MQGSVGMHAKCMARKDCRRPSQHTAAATAACAHLPVQLTLVAAAGGTAVVVAVWRLGDHIRLCSVGSQVADRLII